MRKIKMQRIEMRIHGGVAEGSRFRKLAEQPMRCEALWCEGIKRDSVEHESENLGVSRLFDLILRVSVRIIGCCQIHNGFCCC